MDGWMDGCVPTTAAAASIVAAEALGERAGALLPVRRLLLLGISARGRELRGGARVGLGTDCCRDDRTGSAGGGGSRRCTRATARRAVGCIHIPAARYAGLQRLCEGGGGNRGAAGDVNYSCMLEAHHRAAIARRACPDCGWSV
eukprot:scaffold820_cov376-Prasinococcus_capsulatus_cf.AAC.14